MNYELAKKLKDAGFPQEFKAGDYGICDIVGGCNGVHGYLDFSFKEGAMYDGSGEYGCGDSSDGFIRVPTLSELIEACGDKFGSLRKYIDCTNGGYKYLADAFIKHEIVTSNNKTPEEAVANLWLLLKEQNKKDYEESQIGIGIM